MSETITFRLHIHSLDSAGASFKWASGVQTTSLFVDADRFKELGRPGWVEITVTPIGGTQ